MLACSSWKAAVRIKKAMVSPRSITLLLAAVLGVALAPAAARAAAFDSDGFHLQSSALSVQESAGNAVITVERTDTRRAAQIRYISVGRTARPGVDYVPVKSMIDFAQGQSSATFTVPIIDHGVPSIAKTIQIALFGPSPIGLGTPSTATLTIVGDDPMTISRDQTNPLALPPATVAQSGDPLAGARFYVDWNWGSAALQAEAWAHSKPAASRMLDVIAREPTAHRFGSWDGAYPGLKVSEFLARASVEQPGTVPMIETYRIVGGNCGNWSDPPAAQAAYHNWITSFARGISGYRAVLFLEMDSLITVGCLNHHGVDVRMHELRDAINVLTANCPRLVIYLDAGAADAVPAAKISGLLRRAGVAKIQGFFLNSTHFDWTSHEIRFGQQISRMTGGKHFVISTAANGRGPLVPPDPVRQGNEVLCNPPGRGLGPKPTTNTGYRFVDAFAWIGNPGESGGACVPGAPPTGAYWPAYALMLVRDADFRVH
jgi:endoglucanase